MKKLKFLFGVHCHQPVGNFEHIFTEAYERAYKPFLEVLARHPRVKFAAHYSGVLYDWFKANRPEMFDLLKKLVKRDQIEILSGGHYEPVLPVIPEEDRLGQIELANDFIRDHFWRAPKGLWLTERVWEPNLPKALTRAGIEYTLVDDDHFVQAGLSPDDLFGYYVTEDEGDMAKLFPINRRLRELIPFREPEEIIDYLKSIPNPDGNAAVVFIDDGEKFGLRPETYEWVYGQGYLDRLLTALEASQDWLEFISFSDYLEDYPARGRIYLPSSAYFEMQDWARSAEGPEQGYFRNFFVKYPEANNMHKKMLYVSQKLKTQDLGKTIFGAHKNKAELSRARLELYKGQCSCAFWHGLFGGLYLNHLRHGVYSCLIRAENEIDQVSHGNKPFAELSITDLDKDGSDEVVLANNMLNLYFSPKRGGALYELDYKPKAFNLINTLARREELYHDDSVVCDGRPRAALQDHFLAPGSGLAEFSSSGLGESGDFVQGDYAFMPGRQESAVSLRLGKEGRVQGTPVRVEKTVSLYARQSIFTVEYEVTNIGQEPDEFWFASEFNFSLLAGNSPDRYYVIDRYPLENRRLSSVGENAYVRSVKLVDEWSGFDVLLETSRPATLWRWPIETVSRSESGLEKLYQSSVVMPSWKFQLKPNEAWKVKLTIRIEE